MFATPKQARAIRKEFDEALEVGNYIYAWNIFQANRPIFTKNDEIHLTAVIETTETTV